MMLRSYACAPVLAAQTQSSNSNLDNALTAIAQVCTARHFFFYWQDLEARLTVEGHTVAAVVVAVEGLCAETAASIPDGDCLV